MTIKAKPGDIIEYDDLPPQIIDRLLAMTLRDWFAGQALAGIRSTHGYDYTATSVATMAYRDADAMLAERAKEAT